MPTQADALLQLPSKSSSGVRAKLVAREIDILHRELDTKAVVYVMGRAHMRMRSEAKSALEWYADPICAELVLTISRAVLSLFPARAYLLIHLHKHGSLARACNCHSSCKQSPCVVCSQ